MKANDPAEEADRLTWGRCGCRCRIANEYVCLLEDD